MCGLKRFGEKMRCAIDVNFIYNGEGHGKIVIQEASRTVLDRAAKKDSANTGCVRRKSAQASGTTDEARGCGRGFAAGTFHKVMEFQSV